MALVYPRDFPSGIRFLEVPTFELMQVEAVNRFNESETHMELGSPFWMASFQTEPLGKYDRARLSAWKDSLRGGKTFYGIDPFRWWPRAYGKSVLTLLRHGGGAYDGTAKLLGIAGQTAQISTVPTNYQASDGDMIEIPRAGGISLHTILEAVQAVAGVVTLTIDPSPFADSVINSVAVRLVKARAIMCITTGTFNAPAGVGKKSATFQAVQTAP